MTLDPVVYILYLIDYLAFSWTMNVCRIPIFQTTALLLFRELLKRFAYNIFKVLKNFFNE